MTTSVAIANDHAGLDLKHIVMRYLSDRGMTITDLGTQTYDSVDYPDYADRMAEALSNDPECFGILICGTGIGISIAANRHPHIRAALCHNSTDARLSRQHNDANIIALGARTMGSEVALECIETFLNTAFEGGRHERRIAKMSPNRRQPDRLQPDRLQTG
jgi:ribose 5-phosphate isomerase B